MAAVVLKDSASSCQFMHRYESRAALTNMVHFKAMINNPPAKRIEDLAPDLMRVEGHMRNYNASAGGPLREEISVAARTSLCVEELGEILEMANKEMSYKNASRCPWSDRSPCGSAAAPPPPRLCASGLQPGGGHTLTRHCRSIRPGGTSRQ